MLGFEQTETGYRVTDEQVAWWESRDTCPACAAVVEPVRENILGGTAMHEYECRCETPAVRWSREA